MKFLKIIKRGNDLLKSAGIFKYVLSVSFISIMLIGCSSTYMVSDFPSKEKFYEDFNDFVKNKNVKVILLNDSSYSVTENNSNIKFELGIRDELIMMFAKEYNSQSNGVGNTTKLSIPLNLHLSAGIRFFKNYKIDIRAGWILVDENFYGFDEGIYLQALLFNTNIYATAGIDFFNDTGTSHNSATSGGRFILYGFGLGYETSPNFNIDLMFGIPNKKIYGYDINTGYYPFGQTYDKVNNGIIRLGFQYSFLF